MTLRVLVFDDDATVERLVVRIATMSDIAAVAVTDAASFASHLHSHSPQVVMLDVQLGDTDGVEQLRLLAERQYTGSLVLMSGFDTRVLQTARAIGQALGLKIQGVLEKPLRCSEVEQTLARLLAANLSLSSERLLQAIANDELALDFQPIVSRNPRELKKLEALIRWDHPVLGRVSPNDFLATAESGVATINVLTDWIVAAAVDAYLVLDKLCISIPLSVNVSPRNLHDLALSDRIERRLREGGMPTRHLCLEITENAAFKDPVQTMDVLTRLRLKGVQLSVDDFGAGYSSLKLLRQMPFSEIKIDQSFIGDLTVSRDSRAIVQSIIDLAANMGMSCVAEGIETGEVADLLEQMGVRNLQGYFIARPMPIEAIQPWLTRWKQQGDETSRKAILDAVGLPGVTPDDTSASQALSAPLRAKLEGQAALLSPRQLEVMTALSEGCSVKEIARRLRISPSTVKVHLSLAYTALGANNRIEAVMRAGLHLASPAKKSSSKPSA